jgi:glyoxylase-like metal-dependent hydrolase (beta-lactamase superfamily II)
MLLTIGRLSMNKFWGETERQRSPLCTSTLLMTDAGLAIVDPSVHPPEIPALLRDQAGVRPEDVRCVLLTHFHGDHRFGLQAFPEATWQMAEPEIAYWRARAGEDEQGLLKRILPADESPLPGCDLFPTPGHTPGHHSLRFTWRGLRVVIAGDAVMTEDFYWAREGYLNSVDQEQAHETIDRLARDADVIIPGHGNVFATNWSRSPGS